MAASDLPLGNEGSLTGDAALTVLAAPAASKQRIIPVNGLTFYNADTVAHDITVYKKKGASSYQKWKTTALAAGAVAVVDVPITLDATDESVEAVVDADATTTEPTFDVSAMETS